MIVEFIKDYKTCHKAGNRFDAQSHFAEMLIECGFAKEIKKPNRNKMISKPVKDKKLYSVEREV